MAHTSISRHYAAPIEQAWALAMDLPRWPKWFPSLLEVREISGPTDQVGTTAILVMKGPDKVHQLRLELTQVERPRVHAHIAREVGGGMTTASSIHLTASGTGTDMRWQQDITPAPGLFGAVADKLILGRYSERQMREACDGFEALLNEAKVSQPV